MDFLKKLGRFKTKPIPNYGKIIIRPTLRALCTAYDGCPYEAPSDILCKRDNRWTQNEFTIILPGLTEWCERYRQAVDSTTNTIRSDFDWRGWHREGLLFAKEIYRRLPRYIPLRYERPAGDNSGLIEDFDVAEEKIESLLSILGVSGEDRDPVICDCVVTGVKDDDGMLAVRFRIKGKREVFTFHVEYNSIDKLKGFLEGIALSEKEPVAWESEHTQSGMYFYPQTIGSVKHMGQLHINVSCDLEPEFYAYLNARQFVGSVYRTILANVNTVEGVSVYEKMHSDTIEWYIDDDKYEQYLILRKNPKLAKWLTPAIFRAKDFFKEIYDAINEDDV